MALKGHAGTKQQKGFTIVELMIAISIFSMIILMVSAVIIGIAKTYQKASYTTKLNDASRNFHQEIKNAANEGSGIGIAKSGSDHYKRWVCAGTTVYYWTQGHDASLPQPGLFKLTNQSTCPGAFPSGGVNILPDGAYVYTMNSGELQMDSSVMPRTLTTKFAVGSSDMHEDNKLQNQCLPVLKGGDFCARVEYSSTIGNIRVAN